MVNNKGSQDVRDLLTSSTAFSQRRVIFVPAGITFMALVITEIRYGQLSLYQRHPLENSIYLLSFVATQVIECPVGCAKDCFERIIDARNRI